jgi:hypothetical protein
MRCPGCGEVIATGSQTCPKCRAPRPQIEPAFARAEQSYLRLRQQYDSAAISADEFKAGVEAQRLEYDGRYWVLGVNSGQWYDHDGTSWQEQDPPIITAREHPKTLKPTFAPGPESFSRQPSKPATARRSGIPAWVVIPVGVSVLMLVAFYIYRAMPAHDPLVKRLMTTPLPKTSYSETDLATPEMWNNDKDADAGQVAQVVIEKRSLKDVGGYTFTVFRSPANVQSSYNDAVNSFKAQAGQLSARGVDIINLPGITGICFRGRGRIRGCRSLAGRTTVALAFPESKSEEEATQSAQALVKHALSLQE